MDVGDPLRLMKRQLGCRLRFVRALELRARADVRLNPGLLPGE